MRLSTDDAVYRVDNRFLGPQGFTVARVGIRYQAIGVGFLLWVPTMMALRVIGVAGFVGVLLSLAVTTAATLLIMHFVDYDRPLISQLLVLAHEITAPRPVQDGQQALLLPAQIRVTTVRGEPARHQRRRR